MALNVLHAILEPLIWESNFFGISSARVRLCASAPILTEADFSIWERVQAKIPADRNDVLHFLQKNGFRIVEEEIDFTLKVSIQQAINTKIASEQDIPDLKKLVEKIFPYSRFHPPWYAPNDSSRLYFCWVENAVKGIFDHICLTYCQQKCGSISGFVSLRRLNNHEGRIGLLVGPGIGKMLIKAALNWAYQQQLSVLRVATQKRNTAALKLYTVSGADINTVSYWLYR